MKTKEEIMGDLIYRLEQRTPINNVDPGSVARTFLEILTEEFFDFYGQLEVNFTMSFVSTAIGRYLDLIGGLLDCKRLDNESDDNYRARITKQVYVVAGANLTAIRLKALQVPGVRDLMFRQYTHGTGSFTVYVITDDAESAQSIINQVQTVVDDTKAYGIYGEVKTPVLIPLELKVRLVFSDEASPNERESIRQNVARNVKDYVNHIPIGDTFILNECIQRIMETNQKIRDIDIYSLKVKNLSRFVGNVNCKREERFVLDALDIT